jgi:peptidoglycan/LPS O-acetylase OafA/YrhL
MSKNFLAGPSKHINPIDGLRALAVAAVFIYHLDAWFLPGGFTGVDIFFVISGFVVALSVDGMPIDNFPTYLSQFYKRRILRIMPALLTYVIVMVTFSALFIPAIPYTKFIEPTGISSIFGLSNIVIYLKQGGYFDAATEFNTFTHTWSLGVEEQYYMLFPLISYFILIRGVRDQRYTSAVAILALLIAGSFSACVYYSESKPSFAFYMIFTRFWELGLGFSGYLIAKSSVTTRLQSHLNFPAISEAVSALAFILLIAGLFLSDAGQFPYPWAILPCLATTVLLVTLYLPVSGRVGALLSLKPVVYVGRISYSLYLWHWGVITAMRWTTGLGTPSLKIVAVCISLALAVASYTFIEGAFRKRKHLLNMKPFAFYAAATLSVFFVAGASAGVYLIKPKIGLFAQADKQAWSPYDFPAQSDDCAVKREAHTLDGGWVVSFTPVNCTKTKISGNVLYAVGDSHGGAYERMFYRYASMTGEAVMTYSLGGCRLLDLGEISQIGGCNKFRQDAVKEVGSIITASDTFFAPALYSHRVRSNWDDTLIAAAPAAKSTRNPTDQAATILAPILSKNARILLEGPKPLLMSGLFRCSDWYDRASTYCRAGVERDRGALEADSAPLLARLREIALRFSSVNLWEPFDTLCPGIVCLAYMNGKPLYYDTDHLSGYGNDLLLPSFKAAATRSE